MEFDSYIPDGFESLDFRNQLQELVRAGIFKAAEINNDIPILGSRLTDDLHLEDTLQSVDLSKTYQFENNLYTLSTPCRNYLWELYITMHQLHPLCESIHNEIAYKLDGTKNFNERIEYLKKQIDDLDVFNLPQLRIDFNGFSKNISVSADDRYALEESYTHKWIYSQLSEYPGGYYGVEGALQQEYAEDMALFCLAKSLIYQLNQAQAAYTPNPIEKNNSVVQFRSLIYLDQLGFLKSLKDRTGSNKASSKILSEILGRNAGNINTDLSRLGDPKKWRNSEIAYRDEIRKKLPEV